MWRPLVWLHFVRSGVLFAAFAPRSPPLFTLCFGPYAFAHRYCVILWNHLLESSVQAAEQTFLPALYFGGAPMRRPFLLKINFTQRSRRVAFASSHSYSGRVRHQTWLEYCLFLQTWIPPQACDSCPWSGPGHRTRGFLFCISSLTHPAACPRFSQYAPRTATKGSAVIQNRPGRRG